MTTDKHSPVLEPATAINTQKLIEYAADSIVSKTLIKREKGTLTMFAFDKGQALSEHTAPFDALLQIVDGEAEMTIGGQRVNAREGEVVLMPANVPHAIKATTPMKMLLTMIRQ